MDTEGCTIAEASPYDRIWGIGISVAEAGDGDEWRGTNLLGIALMRVRDMIVNELPCPQEHVLGYEATGARAALKSAWRTMYGGDHGDREMTTSNTARIRLRDR